MAYRWDRVHLSLPSKTRVVWPLAWLVNPQKTFSRWWSTISPTMKCVVVMDPIRQKPEIWFPGNLERVMERLSWLATMWKQTLAEVLSSSICGECLVRWFWIFVIILAISSILFTQQCGYIPSLGIWCAGLALPIMISFSILFADQWFSLYFWFRLVKTGKYRAGDENRPGAVSPDEVFETFADFMESLIAGHWKFGII